LFAVGLHTCTAVARSLCASWAFLFLSVSMMTTDGRRTTIADERNPSKTKELDRSYTPRKLTIENSSRREDGRKKNKREAKDQDA